MIARGLLPAYHAARLVEARTLVRWIVACVAVVGVTVAASAAFVLTTPGPDPHVLAQIDDARKRIAEADASAATWRAKAAESTRRILASKAVGEHPDWALLVDRIVAVGGPSIAVEEFAVTREAAVATGPGADKKPKQLRWLIAVSGLAPKQTAVVSMVTAMEDWKLFDRVRLVESKARTVGATDAVSFKIEAVLEEVVR